MGGESEDIWRQNKEGPVAYSYCIAIQISGQRKEIRTTCGSKEKGYQLRAVDTRLINPYMSYLFQAELAAAREHDHTHSALPNWYLADIFLMNQALFPTVQPRPWFRLGGISPTVTRSKIFSHCRKVSDWVKSSDKFSKFSSVWV